ncbi:MAG: hypothetical protein R3B84_02420 [Zavarzinella sp.]
MDWTSIGIVDGMLLFTFTSVGLAAVVVAWAVQNGEFRNSQRTAESLFDSEEPIGTPTDRLWFPAEKNSGNTTEGDQ